VGEGLRECEGCEKGRGGEGVGKGVCGKMGERGVGVCEKV
jgi:hypothetical protein